MITILVLVAWLTNGTPLPNTFILPPGHPCDQKVAVEYASSSLPASASWRRFSNRRTR
jgi:hypothetical protein